MRKKKIFTILFIIVITVMIFVIGYITISLKSINDSKKQTQEFINKYNQLVKDEQISYVIVEINPKILLKVVNNIVIDTTCLNYDCEEIFVDDVTGKKIDETIESLYEKAKESGIDVSKGVLVLSSNDEIDKELNEISYVNYNNITKEEEKIILNQIENSEEIEQEQDSYNKKMLELYEKDPDYGKVYKCNIENNDIVCYITEEFEKELPTEISLVNKLYYNEKHQILMNTLNKFNIEYECSIEKVEGLDVFKANQVIAIKIENIMHQFGVSYYVENSNSSLANSNSIVLSSTLESGEYGYSYEVLPISKLELISKAYNKNDVITLKNYHNTTISISNPEM